MQLHHINPLWSPQFTTATAAQLICIDMLCVGRLLPNSQQFFLMSLFLWYRWPSEWELLYLCSTIRLLNWLYLQQQQQQHHHHWRCSRPLAWWPMQKFFRPAVIFETYGNCENFKIKRPVLFALAEMWWVKLAAGVNLHIWNKLNKPTVFMVTTL